MLKPFHVRIPDTVVGTGAVSQIGGIAESLNPEKILVLTDAGLVKAGIVETVTAPIKEAGLKFEVFDGCKEEPPIGLMEEIAGTVKEGNFDLLIGIGGGSVMDTAKVVSAIAFTGMSIGEYVGSPFHESFKGRVLPKILVPTTAGTGSEWSIVTTVYDHEKGIVHVVQSWQNMADRVIIDPELTLKLPQRLTADTGIDALAHAIEAYVSPNANIFSDMLAGKAIEIISGNLRRAYAKGQVDLEARYNMSIAAAMAMNAVISASIGLSHIINDSLGPRARVSHGTTVALTLPAVMEYNIISNPARFARIAELMGEKIGGLSTLDAASKAAEAVRRLIKDLNLPQRLSDVGIKESDIGELARRCCEAEQPVIDAFNPRDAAEEDIIRILNASL